MTTETPIADSPVLLLIANDGEEFDGLDVPAPAENLFNRIIRNPLAPDRPARERRCTEMLCGVLINCPELRSAVLTRLAVRVGCPPDIIADLDWRMETERPIDAKRDDLRIEGWRVHDDEEALEVLWTVEVKVRASFHASSDQTYERNETGDDAPMVNQLLNYDAWLQQQDCPHKAGFVLAIPNHRDDLPDGLTCRWDCLTWTALGEIVADSLARDSLPPAERPFARHLLGFIRHHLWSREEMTETRLTFDHVALMRAVWAMGKDCERIVNDLVAPLEGLIRQSGLAVTGMKHTRNIFMGSQRSVIYGYLVEGPGREVFLFAGMDGGGLAVWIESSTRHPQKAAMRETLKGLLPRLRARNDRWAADTDVVQDIRIEMPLLDVLVASDQAHRASDFVAAALADLKAVEIDRLIQGICEGGTQ